MMQRSPSMPGLRYGSVCSGIEAASVAWHPLGWSPAWFAEIDAFPSAVLAERWPGIVNLGDFTKIGAEREAIDLLVGGTPCQDFSVAGKRAGLDAPRGNLTLEYLALARRLRPRWLVWENVPGVLSIDRGRTFGTILWLMGELGYGFAYRILDAQFFGVPQRRRRVFVVGHFGDWRAAAAVLFERSSLSGDPAPSREAGTRVAGTLEARASTSDATDPLIAWQTNGSNVGPQGTLRAGDGGLTSSGIPFLADPICANEARTYANAGNNPRPCNVIAFDTTQVTIRQNRSKCLPDTPTPTLGRETHPPAVAFNMRGREGGSQLEPADAASLRAGHGRASRSFVHTSSVRRLTPRECERLQGFPDDYTLVEYNKKPAKDGPRYRALGNSMAVPVMRWIGQRIAAVETIVGAKPMMEISA